MDYVGDPANAKLYHWTDFEIGQMKGVAARHRSLNKRINLLIESCVDLKEAIKGSVYIPVPTYSIKKVAPFLGFKWRHDDVDAMTSMVLYWEYLENPKSKTIQKVIDYNEDNCKAMVYTDDNLQELIK